MKDGNWSYSQTIEDPIQDPESAFGAKMALSDERIAVASPYEAPNGTVYFYSVSEGVWTLESEFQVPGEDLGNTFTDLDLDGTTLAIGYPWASRGVVFIAENQAGEWDLTQEIRSPQTSYALNFGFTLALHGDELAISDPSQFNSHFGNSGGVHFYGRNNGMWEPTQELEADQMDFLDPLDFGWGLEFNEHTLAIGALQDQDFGVQHGAMHLYKRRTDPQRVRTDGPWERIDKVYPYDISDTRRFGWVIAIHGDTLAVAALSEPMYDPNLDTTVLVTKSTLTIFHRQGDSWFYRDTLYLAGEHLGDYFGRATALQRDQLVVGVPFINYIESIGQAIVYDISCLSSTCVGDLNLDGNLNFFDVAAFIEAYQGQCEIADLNQDGDLNFLDVSVLLSALAGGC